ncbi:MAG: phenylalanine--tRNA ligase subunit beta [Rhodothermia bacterium]|nr:phenylalanine--tRNA ligase subunit beta [Rhodothermia bacterium]
MKISYNWLQDYVDVGIAVGELAEKLTMAGLEVESVDQIGAVPGGVVVGHVLEVTKHPDADRLTVCSVDVGDEEPLQIVCGAPNVAVGQKVPVALVGSSLELPSRDAPDQRTLVKIRRAKIRGTKSEGMICAEDELGLSDDHSGIMVLEEDAIVGTPFSDYLASVGRRSDAVLDIAITPNRPDAASHLGVARDVAALTDSTLHTPEVDVPADGGDAADHVTISIEDDELCRRYVGVVVRGVTIGDSPDWLKERLTVVGLRPRNNVVDVTNYVMYECGQPLHAFDLEQIAGPSIIVRPTKEPGKFVTLDDEERELPAGTLMICDADREGAIAGVMGGQNSEVSEKTKDVLIESAYFSPASIRRTAKALGLQTDASYRFERGVDTEIQAWAAMRAAFLMQEVAGGKVVDGIVDEHPNPSKQRALDLRLARIQAITGMEVAREEVVGLLTQIGFEVVDDKSDVIRFRVPPHRPDVEREIDLIEEVARLYGYDRIEEPKTTPVPSFTPRDRPEDLARQRILGLAAGWGYREVYTNSLLPEGRASEYCDSSILGDLGGGAPVRTANAISREMTTLRPSLLPGALSVIRHNLNHGQDGVRVIEFGHVFTKQDLPDNIIPGYEEHESLLIACAGSSGQRHWGVTDRSLDFFDLKGTVAAILNALEIHGVEETEYPEAAGVAAYRLEYATGGTVLGFAAMLDPERASAEGIDTPVYFAELNWSRLLRTTAIGSNSDYVPVNRFPTVERDLAFVVDEATRVGHMQDTIRQEGKPLLTDVRVFDVYEGKGVGASRKSVAFALRFSANRTLTDADVDEQVAKIVKSVARVHTAELRD